MAEGGAGQLIGSTLSTFGNGFNSPLIKWMFIILLVGGLIGLFTWFYKKNKKDKMRWNKTFRVWHEDKRTNIIPLDPYVIKASGVVLDGQQYIYLKKPLLGRKLMPLLNDYTKRGLYDLLVTADGRFLLLTGISGINKQRKELGVHIRYPGVEHQFDEINRKYDKMHNVNQFDRTLEIIKRISAIVWPIILLIGLIVGGNYLVDISKNEEIKSQVELELMQIQLESAIAFKESGDTMVVILEQLKDVTGTNNIKSHIDSIKNEVIA